MNLDYDFVQESKLNEDQKLKQRLNTFFPEFK